MKTSACVLFMLAGAATLACGSLGDPGKKPVLATITGELQESTPQSVTVSPASAGGTRVAVVWLGLSNNYSVAEDLPVQPVFPSRFQLALSDPPPDDVIVTAAKVPKEPAATPPGPGPSPTPAPPSGGAQPKDLDVNVSGWPADFGFAVGSIVAYDDLNGNGRLDLVDDGATAYVDRILGANTELLLMYFQGTFPPNVVQKSGQSISPFADMQGVAPLAGYNLLDLKECAATATDLGGAGGATPAAPPCTPRLAWMPVAGTLYTLPLTGDPTWGDLMCRKGTNVFGGSSGSAEAPASTPGSGGSGQPPPQADAGAAIDASAGDGGAAAPDPSLPAANDPKLQCAPDGRSFTYDCHPTPPPQPKLCSGPQIAETGCGAWIRPSPPPSNWPCPSP